MRDRLTPGVIRGQAKLTWRVRLCAFLSQRVDHRQRLALLPLGQAGPHIDDLAFLVRIAPEELFGLALVHLRQRFKAALGVGLLTILEPG